MSEPKVGNPQPEYDQYTQQLIEQYNEIAQLAGALAHEIKNPLSVIRMNVDLLTEDLASDAKIDRRRTLQKTSIVQHQCERLQNLLNDFLKFARLRQLDLSPGSLNEQVMRVLDLFDAQARESNIDVVTYLDPDLPSIMLDEQTIEAALVNLVKNAFEAMEEGGQLTARTRLTRNGVALDLIDTGCGMEPGTAGSMFEAFFSTKDGGSGLGLPTAKKVIEAHGARIVVQSEVGHGTQFTLEFPMPRRLPSADTSPTESPVEVDDVTTIEPAVEPRAGSAASADSAHQASSPDGDAADIDAADANNSESDSR